MPPRKVMIGTPAKDGRTECHYTNALAHSMYRAAQRGMNLYPMFIPYDSFIQHARNRLMKMMLEQGCDDLVFIDADTDWDPDWVFRLLDHPVDCVGGTYPRKQDTEHYEVRWAEPAQREPATGLIGMRGLGAGFLRLSRKAVMALWEGAQPYVFKGEQHRLMCDVTVADGHMMGEDIVLCENLVRRGFSVWLDDTMTCGHTGPKRWTGDVRPWLARMEATAAPMRTPDRTPDRISGSMLERTP